MGLKGALALPLGVNLAVLTQEAGMGACRHQNILPPIDTKVHGLQRPVLSTFARSPAALVYGADAGCR